MKILLIGKGSRSASSIPVLDEIPDDANQITVTFNLTDVLLDEEPKLF